MGAADARNAYNRQETSRDTSETLQFREREEDVYPMLAQYLNLYRQYGLGGAGQAGQFLASG
jgi:hypothetical protein